MADNDGRSVPQEGIYVTKETLEDMMKQMEGRIFTALSEHLKVTSADATISSKPMDRGKGVGIEKNQNEFCDSGAQLEDQGMLPHLGHKSLVRVPVTSQQQVSPFRPSTWTFSEHLSEPVFTEERIRQLVQEEVQEAQTGTKRYSGFSNSDRSPRVQEGAENGPQVSQVTKVTKVPRDRRNNMKKEEGSVHVLSAPAISGPSNPNFLPRGPFNSPRGHPIPLSQNCQPGHQGQPWRFDPLPVTYAEVYQRLVVEGRIAPIPQGTSKNLRNFNPNARCIYHSGQVGHDIESCIPLKYRVQDMIRAKQLNFTSKPNVNANLLPSRDAPIVGTRGLQSPQCIEATSGQGYEVKKGDGTVDDWSAPANLRPPARNSSCYPAPLSLSQSNLRQPTLQYVKPVWINTHHHHVPSASTLQRNPASRPSQSLSLVARQRKESRFRHFDTFPVSYAELFRQLAAKEMISPVIPTQVSNPPPGSYNPSLRCLYHSDGLGHDTENCTALKNLIQDLYEDGKIKFYETPVQPRGPNIPQNPLPNHNARH